MTPFPLTARVLNLLEEPKALAAFCLLFFGAEVRIALCAVAWLGLDNRILFFPITTVYGSNADKN